MSRTEKRGEAGARALRKNRQMTKGINEKKVKEALEFFISNKIPIVPKQVAEKAGISYSTINRTPYNKMVYEYMEKEKPLLSPNAKHEYSGLIEKNSKLEDEIKRLKEELEEFKEKYERLRKESTYLKELYT